MIKLGDHSEYTTSGDGTLGSIERDLGAVGVVNNVWTDDNDNQLASFSYGVSHHNYSFTTFDSSNNQTQNSSYTNVQGFHGVNLSNNNSSINLSMFPGGTNVNATGFGGNSGYFFNGDNLGINRNGIDTNSSINMGNGLSSFSHDGMVLNLDSLDGIELNNNDQTLSITDNTVDLVSDGNISLTSGNISMSSDNAQLQVSGNIFRSADSYTLVADNNINIAGSGLTNMQAETITINSQSGGGIRLTEFSSELVSNDSIAFRYRVFGDGDLIVSDDNHIPNKKYVDDTCGLSVSGSFSVGDYSANDIIQTLVPAPEAGKAVFVDTFRVTFTESVAYSDFGGTLLLKVGGHIVGDTTFINGESFPKTRISRGNDVNVESAGFAYVGEPLTITTTETAVGGQLDVSYSIKYSIFDIE